MKGRRSPEINQEVEAAAALDRRYPPTGLMLGAASMPNPYKLQAHRASMRIVVPAVTPVITKAIEFLRETNVNEVGSTVLVETASTPSPSSVIVSPTLTDVHAEILIQNPEAGIVLLSARTQIDEFRTLLHTKQLSPRRLALFATHASTFEDRQIMRQERIQEYSMLRISREGLNEMTDAVMSYAREWPGFHLIINLDVVDPAYAPGLTKPYPGGLTARELIYVVQRLRLIKSLLSVEIVVDASQDDMTCRLVAKLLAELQ